MRKTILGVILNCACFWGIAFGGWVIVEEAEEDKSTIYEEVVQVEEKSLKKELFIPPADYRKVAFSEVFK